MEKIYLYNIINESEKRDLKKEDFHEYLHQEPYRVVEFKGSCDFIFNSSDFTIKDLQNFHNQPSIDWFDNDEILDYILTTFDHEDLQKNSDQAERVYTDFLSFFEETAEENL